MRLCSVQRDAQLVAQIHLLQRGGLTDRTMCFEQSKSMSRREDDERRRMGAVRANESKRGKAVTFKVDMKPVNDKMRIGMKRV